MLGRFNQLAKKLLGPRFYKMLRFYADLIFTHRKPTYSQFGEDQFLLEYFRDQKSGFFVDVGAFHPRQFSNTYALYRMGWHGLNIDATPGSMRLFRLLRPQDFCVEAAISDRIETVEFASWGAHAENSALPAQVEGVTRDQGRPVQTLKLQTRTLSSILDSLPQPLPPIDLLSVDVEGMDLQVLRSLDWSRHAPKIVISELFADRIEDILSSELYGFMKEKGYRLGGWYRPSLVFEHAL